MTNDQLNYEEMQNFLNQTEVPINAAEGQHNNNNNNDGQQQQATSTSNGGNTNPYVVDLRVLEAALESDWPTVRKLLPSARDMELADQDGWSVLHFACREGVDDVVKVCLMKGAHVDKAKKNLWTGLHLASRNQKPSTAEVLLRHAANANAKNDRGNTPLIEVFNRRRKKDSNTLLSLLALLLQYGADPNLKGEEGKTCLHKAAERGYDEAVAFLLRSGADPSIRDDLGNTPVVLAMAGKHSACVQLLEGFFQHDAQQKSRFSDGNQQRSQPLLERSNVDNRAGRSNGLMLPVPTDDHRQQRTSSPAMLTQEPAAATLNRQKSPHRFDLPVINGPAPMNLMVPTDAFQQRTFSPMNIIKDQQQCLRANNNGTTAIYTVADKSPGSKIQPSTPTFLAQAAVHEQTMSQPDTNLTHYPQGSSAVPAAGPNATKRFAETDDRYLQQEVRHQKFLFMFDKQEMALARMRTEMARLESRLASLETEVRNSDRARANGIKTVNNRVDALEKMMASFSTESVASTAYRDSSGQPNSSSRTGKHNPLQQRKSSRHRAPVADDSFSRTPSSPHPTVDAPKFQTVAYSNQTMGQPSSNDGQFVAVPYAEVHQTMGPRYEQLPMMQGMQPMGNVAVPGQQQPVFFQYQMPKQGQ